MGLLQSSMLAGLLSCGLVGASVGLKRPHDDVTGEASAVSEQAVFEGEEMSPANLSFRHCTSVSWAEASLSLLLPVV
jgi:hypothetical protein